MRKVKETLIFNLHGKISIYKQILFLLLLAIGDSIMAQDNSFSKMHHHCKGAFATIEPGINRSYLIIDFF